jgi:hypothetical protein
MYSQLWFGSRTAKSRAARDRSRRPQALRPSVEALDERYALSTGVVISSNEAVLAAIRAAKPTIGFLTRDPAIVQTDSSHAGEALNEREFRRSG